MGYEETEFLDGLGRSRQAAGAHGVRGAWTYLERVNDHFDRGPKSVVVN